MASSSQNADEHDSKLLEFQEVCAVDDPNLARSILERYDWDLQVINTYLNIFHLLYIFLLIHSLVSKFYRLRFKNI